MPTLVQAAAPGATPSQPRTHLTIPPWFPSFTFSRLATIDELGDGFCGRGQSQDGYMGSTGQKQERVLRTMVAPLWDKLMQGVSVMSRQG